jgi:hypothetical protein
MEFHFPARFILIFPCFVFQCGPYGIIGRYLFRIIQTLGTASLTTTRAGFYRLSLGIGNHKSIISHNRQKYLGFPPDRGFSTEEKVIIRGRDGYSEGKKRERNQHVTFNPT